MSDDHLESSPHKIRGTDQAWWYEEPAGICIVIEPNVTPQQLIIPWKSLEGALQRKRKKE